MEAKQIRANLESVMRVLENSGLRLRGKDKFISDDLMRAREILAVIAKGIE